MKETKSTSKPGTFKPCNRFLEEIKRKNNEKRELISNYEYISWLEKFTLIHECFSDDSWLYKPKELSEADNANVKKLSIFFEILYDYCNKYYINVSSKEVFEAERINIKHNGIGYQIGLVVGQGAYVYVERKVPENDAIEFCDVLNGTIPENFEVKKAMIKKYEQLITEMKAIGIPKAVILEIANK